MNNRIDAIYVFCSISSACQYVIAPDFCLFQQLGGMDGIMVISRRQQKACRVPQSIHNYVQLCVESSSSSSNRLIRCFFLLHWRFHGLSYKQNPGLDSPCPHRKTMPETRFPAFRHPAIWQNGHRQTARGHMPLVAPAIALRGGRSKASH